MRIARLRAPAWILLFSLSACANIWGFDDLRTGEDGGGVEIDASVKLGPEGGGRDVTVDQSIDVRSPTRDVEDRDVRPGTDVSVPEAGHDADSSVPDARDADAAPEADTTAPDVADVAPGPDANDSTAPETGAADVSVESSADSTVPGSDVTDTGTIVALVTAPTGNSNPDFEVIRDGVFPPVGSSNPATEYDTNDGTTKTEDWIGYEFPAPETFTAVVYQEGIHFTDGGWFTTLQLEVDDGTGNWMPVVATVTPAYGANNVPSFETYTFMLTPPVTGMGIRIDGTPGGAGTYISVGELRVFAQ